MWTVLEIYDLQRNDLTVLALLGVVTAGVGDQIHRLTKLSCGTIRLLPTEELHGYPHDISYVHELN